MIRRILFYEVVATLLKISNQNLDLKAHSSWLTSPPPKQGDRGGLSRLKAPYSLTLKKKSIMEDSKKMLWRTIINVVVAALSAIATALGVTSCMGLGPI